MSQSFVNTGSLSVELGLGSPQIEEVFWSKFVFQLNLFERSIRFLRYPNPSQGLGYRMLRAGVIVALRVRGMYKR